MEKGIGIAAYGDESIDDEWFVYAFVLVDSRSNMFARLVQGIRKYVRQQAEIGLLSPKAAAAINDQLHERFLAHEYPEVWKRCIDDLRLALASNRGSWSLVSVRMAIPGGIATQRSRIQAYSTALIAFDEFWTRRGQPFGLKAQLDRVCLHTLPSGIDAMALRETRVSFNWDAASPRQQGTLIVADWLAGLVRRAQRHQLSPISHHRTAARFINDGRVRVRDRKWLHTAD